MTLLDAIELWTAACKKVPPLYIQVHVVDLAFVDSSQVDVPCKWNRTVPSANRRGEKRNFVMLRGGSCASIRSADGSIRSRRRCASGTDKVDFMVSEYTCVSWISEEFGDGVLR